MSCGCGCGGEVVAYEDWNETDVTAAEYQGRKVTLNKPFRTPGASKKFGVYTTNEKGNVVLVRFGDPNMEIRRDDLGIGVVDSGKVIERWKLWMNHVVVMM